MLIYNISEEYYDCFQGVIASIAHFWEMDYEIVAIGKIGFGYDIDIKCNGVSERLHPEKCTQFPELWEIMGIKKSDYLVENISFQMLKDSLEKKKPILVWTDLFNCNWGNAYQKKHYFHCYLLTDYLSATGQFIAKDPFYNKENIILKYDEIIQTSFRCSIFERLPLYPEDRGKILDLIRLDAKKYISDECHEKIKRFAEDFSETGCLIELYKEETDVSTIPIIDKIRMYGEQRKAYIVLLESIQKKDKKDIKTSIDYLYQSYQLWKHIKLVLLRGAIARKEVDVFSIKQMLLDIANLEYFAMYNIISSL